MEIPTVSSAPPAPPRAVRAGDVEHAAARTRRRGVGKVEPEHLELVDLAAVAAAQENRCPPRARTHGDRRKLRADVGIVDQDVLDGSARAADAAVAHAAVGVGATVDSQQAEVRVVHRHGVDLAAHAARSGATRATAAGIERQLVREKVGGD